MIKYYQIPYEPNGRSFKGCDCWGFVMLFLKHEAGIDIGDFQYADDPDQIDPAVFNNWCLEFTEVAFNEREIFDVVLVCCEDDTPVHVGVVLDNKHFIHCLRGAGVAASKWSIWKKKIIGVYRYRGKS